MATVVGNLGPRVRWAFSDRSALPVVGATERQGAVVAGDPLRYADEPREGVSLAPYDRANLADHVGDDPAHVAANRGRLAATVGLDGSHVVSMAPVHGNDVASVDVATGAPVPEVDALVTTVPGLALLVLAADCVPVLLADGAAGVAAVVHAGWRGVLSDVVGTTLEAMADHGARLDRTKAVVGPAICGSCYDVPRGRFDSVVAVSPGAAAVASDGRPGLDLRAGVVDRLRGAGVTATVHGGCTFESSDLYSYRRDHVTGRHGGVVTLLAEEVRP
ncbi:MAG TPA: peptidoglycan editing factor PgeF [Candidatus Nanopelagicales bacterium]|nr:peptidoglycan editing factor PgeF [Candidatus Nanopelagicales bacterium]